MANISPQTMNVFNILVMTVEYIRIIGISSLICAYWVALGCRKVVCENKKFI